MDRDRDSVRRARSQLLLQGADFVMLPKLDVEQRHLSSAENFGRELNNHEKLTLKSMIKTGNCGLDRVSPLMTPIVVTIQTPLNPKR